MWSQNLWYVNISIEGKVKHQARWIASYLPDGVVTAPVCFMCKYRLQNDGVDTCTENNATMTVWSIPLDIISFAKQGGPSPEPWWWRRRPTHCMKVWHLLNQAQESSLQIRCQSTGLSCETSDIESVRDKTLQRNSAKSQQQTNQRRFWAHQEFIYFVFSLPMGDPWVNQNWFGNVNILNKGSRKLLPRWDFISPLKWQLLFLQPAKDWSRWRQILCKQASIPP